MKKETKKEFWKIFNVAAFLFISIFFVLPYLVQISTYFHEKSHVRVLNKYDVANDYEVNFLETIPNFFVSNKKHLGITRFDIDGYEKLNKFQKLEVNTAGIISDLRFLFLIGIYLSFVNVYVFYKVKVKKEYNLILALAINWILFMWLLALIQITIANITYSTGDIFQLVKFLSP